MKKLLFILLFLISIVACKNASKTQVDEKLQKIKILIDTDANNELDDQHALANAFLNEEVFEVVGVTVNNTRNGDGNQGQYDEAERIIKLFNKTGEVPLFKGAEKSYAEIAPNIKQPDFDGHEAVDFIISEALKVKNEKLVLVPIGKLTNIALAFLKEPKIIDKVRVVWLGANYPDPGEYNLDNDTTSVNPVIESGAPFEMVTVRYGKPSGSDAVRITPAQVDENLRGKGPVSKYTITGRHGGEFNNFGEYSANLFAHIDLHGNPPSRAMFDMVALAVIKNESWGQKTEIPAPKLIENGWVDQPENKNKIIVWENFNGVAIIGDLFGLMEKSTP